MKNGETVSLFERELAAYCGASFAVAAANGTCTLSAALVALGVKPGDRVAVPPLTMSATTIAVLNVGAVPVFCDVDPDTWLMAAEGTTATAFLPVSLYGLSAPYVPLTRQQKADVRTNHHLGDDCSVVSAVVDDAAQTLRKHSGASFTSLSFQASKILSTGEGGALLTNDEQLAERARSYLSLGYQMSAGQARIDSNALKSPTFDRHYLANSINGRMNDLTAAEGLRQLPVAESLKGWRAICASYYADAIEGCDWLTPQHVPQGWKHDRWAWAVACDTPERALWLADAMVRHGGEKPYPAWRITYQEPAFKHLAPEMGRWVSTEQIGVFVYEGDPFDRSCPNAESLQPRLLQFQTNNLASAERNAAALRKAIGEAG